MQIFICDFLLANKSMIWRKFKWVKVLLIFHIALLKKLRTNQTTLWQRLQTGGQKEFRYPEHLLLTSICAQHCHRYCLLGPWNKADVTLPFYRWGKWPSERIGNKPKSTHLVVGMARRKERFSRKNSHSTFLLTFHFFLLSHLFPRVPGSFSCHHLLGINTTTTVAVLWVTGLMQPIGKAGKEAHRSSLSAQWVVIY